MAPPRRFRACSGNRKGKRRCTRIRRDERGWHACAATVLDRSQCRFGPHLRLSLLIRVNLRSHFLGPERHTAREVGAPWDTSDRSVRTRRPVRTVPCVAGSSARHWQDYQANQRVIGISIEISSRLAVIRRVSNGGAEQPRRKEWRFARWSEAPQHCQTCCVGRRPYSFSRSGTSADSALNRLRRLRQIRHDTHSGHQGLKCSALGDQRAGTCCGLAAALRCQMRPLIFVQ